MYAIILSLDDVILNSTRT